MFHGRKQPYTQTGISRVPCIRCGNPSVHQWQVCANNNNYVTLCLQCDIDLNELALNFMSIPNSAELFNAYKQRAVGE